MPFKQLDSNTNAKQNLLIIPTGVACGTGDKTEEDLLEGFTKKRDFVTPETNLSVFIPGDGNIYHDGFATIAKRAITHSFRQKAEMLYEGICTKNADGSFKFDNIYLTGGFDTGEVIKELEKIIQERGQLPQRKDNLRTFGFSDASQLHHYLGQRGISSPVYYSADAHVLAWDLAEEKRIKPMDQEITPIPLEAVSESAKKMDELRGYTQPGSTVSVEKSQTHQTALFDDNNLLIVEFGKADEAGREEIKRFVDTVSKFDKPISLVLSKDSSKDAIKVLQKLLAGNEKLKGIPVFWGAPVGHGSCLTGSVARPIPLFAETVIKKGQDGKYQMEIQGRSSEHVKDLSLSERRINEEPPVETKEPITREVEVAGEAGSTGVIMPNLDHIEKGASDYNVHLPKNEYPIQLITGSVDTLLSRGIIDKEKLKELTFDSNYHLSSDELINAKKYIRSFLKGRFRHLPQINYTELTDVNTHAKTYSLSISLLDTLQKCSEKDNKLSSNNMRHSISTHEMSIKRVR